jgi:hypothetical protein
LMLGDSLQANHLFQAGPAGEKRHDARAGLERTRDVTTMFLAVSSRLAQIAIGFTLTGGGKTT